MQKKKEKTPCKADALSDWLLTRQREFGAAIVAVLLIEDGVVSALELKRKDVYLLSQNSGLASDDFDDEGLGRLPVVEKEKLARSFKPDYFG